MIEIDNEIIAKTVERYGVGIQSVVCMEECAELIQAISKKLRYTKIMKKKVAYLRK